MVLLPFLANKTSSRISNARNDFSTVQAYSKLQGKRDHIDRIPSRGLSARRAAPERPSQEERKTAIQEESGTKGDHNRAGGATSEQQARNWDLFSNVSSAHGTL